MLTTNTGLTESPFSAESTTTSSDPIESRIPLIRTPDGGLFCNATTGIVSAPNVLMEITYGSLSIVSGRANREDVQRLTFITSEGLSLPLDYPISTTFAGSGRSFVGLGRNSDLLRLVGSVAIHKGHDDVEMVLRSSLESFANSCTPDTLLTVNRSGAVFEASYGLFNGTRVENVANWTFLLSRSSGYIASVPALVFYRIQSLILQIGPDFSLIRRTIDDDRIKFRNCTRDIVNQLPSINISLRDGAGSFMLLPEDYLEFNDTRDECSMRILEAHDTNRSLWFDPLRIDGMNVRFNSDGSFDICDSNDF